MTTILMLLNFCYSIKIKVAKISYKSMLLNIKKKVKIKIQMLKCIQSFKNLSRNQNYAKMY